MGVTVNQPAIGVGQSWQNMTGSRAAATTYTNTTGKPMAVNVTFIATSGTPTATVAGVTLTGPSAPGTSVPCAISFIVPVGATYSVTATGLESLNDWKELR